MMDLFIILCLVFMVWMCLDCVRRKEHFIWIIIMVVLFPIGAVAYYFSVKSKDGGPQMRVLSPTPRRPVESEDTLQYKEMINKFHKAYHYEKLGLLYLDKKQYDLAIEPLTEAIKRDPESKEARYGLGKSLHGLGKYEEAAAVLEELVKIDKKYDYGNAIFGLAECYRLAGDDEKALAAYEAVINSYHFFKAYYHYAKLLEKKGNKEEAINYMKSIIASSKDLPEYKLEKEKYWIDEAYKYLRKNGVELA
ncbi:MAG: tetratricopeptide repeat protein [Nitrospinales bacterium]